MGVAKYFLPKEPLSLQQCLTVVWHGYGSYLNVQNPSQNRVQPVLCPSSTTYITNQSEEVSAIIVTLAFHKIKDCCVNCELNITIVSEC